MTPNDEKTIREAAMLLEIEATILRECHVRKGSTQWPDEEAEAKVTHDHMMRVAVELRRIAG